MEPCPIHQLTNPKLHIKKPIKARCKWELASQSARLLAETDFERVVGKQDAKALHLLWACSLFSTTLFGVPFPLPTPQGRRAQQMQKLSITLQERK
jgi:hypothetical protein